jgi:hypothetical protein
MQTLFKRLTFYSLILITAFSCADISREKANEDKEQYVQSKVILNADSLKKDVKASTELIELKITKDTLSVVSTAPFLYYPFGKFNTSDDFRTHLPVALSNPENTKDKAIKIYKLSYKNSFVKMFNSDETKLFEVVSGIIYDKEMMLTDSIAIGITKARFLNKFFSNITDNRIPDVSFVKMISGLDGITHLYEFSDGKLKSISFVTDYNFNR